MHLRLEILSGIAISPIVIGPDGAPLQGGRVMDPGGVGGYLPPPTGEVVSQWDPNWIPLGFQWEGLPLTLIRLAGCIVKSS